MSIFFYDENGYDMGGGEWWNFFPPSPDWGESGDPDSSNDDDLSEWGAIPLEPDYEELSAFSGERDWYDWADQMIEALLLDAKDIDPANIRGQGFTDAYEVIEWFESTGLLDIGSLMFEDDLWFPVIEDTGKKGKK